MLNPNPSPNPNPRPNPSPDPNPDQVRRSPALQEPSTALLASLQVEPGVALV